MRGTHLVVPVGHSALPVGRGEPDTLAQGAGGGGEHLLVDVEVLADTPAVDAPVGGWRTQGHLHSAQSWSKMHWSAWRWAITASSASHSWGQMERKDSWCILV